MNQWMQKQPIQGTDLKVYGGGGDVCASLGVRVLGGGVCVSVCVYVVGGGGGYNNVFFSCRRWWTS